MQNKKGVTTGVILIIAAIVLVLVWTQTTLIQDFLGIGQTPPQVVGKCPSSGLTEVTINTQEALAATATNAVTDYYVFEKDGTFVTTGNSGSDGQSVFNLQCAIGKKYDVLVINETALSGYYPQVIEIDASGATDTNSLKMYEYGEINLVSVASSTDPLGAANISAGLGKTCGFTITFNVNESASAFNKPLIMCQVNLSSVIDVDMNGVSEANSKAPTRVSPSSGYTYHTFELAQLLKSTDAAQKTSGTIEFSASTTPTAADAMACKIIDQATYKKAAYQTLTKSEGFIEAAENQETNSDIGAPDTAASSLYFSHGSGYC